MRWWDGNVWTAHLAQDSATAGSAALDGKAPAQRRGWRVRTLLGIAALGVGFYIATRMIGPPNEYHTLICNMGGSCTEVHLLLFLRAAGSVVYLIAWIAAIIALVRWITDRRQSRRRMPAASQVPTQ